MHSSAFYVQNSSAVTGLKHIARRKKKKRKQKKERSTDALEEHGLIEHTSSEIRKPILLLRTPQMLLDSFSIITTFYNGMAKAQQ